MIKPVKLINNIISTGEKALSSGSKTVTDNISDNRQLIDVSGELLQAYKGITVKKLFSSYTDFLQSFKVGLETFKDSVPQALLNKLEKLADNNNFSLGKAISEYYSGLNECITVSDVRKLYPEIKVPELNFEKELVTGIKETVTKNICDEVAKLNTREEKLELLNKYFDKTISKQVAGWEIYPEFKALQSKVTDEIIDGKFIGKKETAPLYQYFNNRMPLRYRLLHTANPEESIIQILKEHFIEGKNFTDINIKTLDGKEINAQRLKRNFDIGTLDKNFRAFIKSSEAQAKQYQNLSELSKKEISSAIMTETWKTSGLRRDLGNETAYKKDWSLVKSVWHKTMFPETTYYETDKLIDAFLLNLFKNGKINGTNTNPIAKYLETPYMDKPKIMLLKRLYKSVKDLETDKNILNSNRFKEYKAKFDIEAMKESIESIEEHYKNAFFKRFWTDERKQRFTNALLKSREIANKNVESSDKILLNAMDTVFSEP